MVRRMVFVGFGAAVLAFVLAMSNEALAQFSDSHRRSTGNQVTSSGRRSPGNFPPGQPNYYANEGRQSSGTRGRSSGNVTVVVPNPYYPGWYYPSAPAYPVPVYPPYGRGTVYVPAPGYYYAPGYNPYYYRPGYYVVPRYPYGF